MLQKGSETYWMNSGKKSLSVLSNIKTVCLVHEPAPELDPDRLGSATTHLTSTCYTFTWIFNTSYAQ